LEDTVCLELIRHKDGSIVNISRISEVIVSNCLSLMLWNLQLYSNSFEWKDVTFSGVKTYSSPLTHFQGVRTPNPRIYAPDCFDCTSFCCWAWNKRRECDILRGSKHILTLPTYFRGSEPPNPQDLRPWWAIRAVDDLLWEGQHTNRDLWGL